MTKKPEPQKYFEHEVPEVIPEISDAVWEEGFNKLQELLTGFESKIRDDYDAAEFETASLGDGTFTRLQVEAFCSLAV